MRNTFLFGKLFLVLISSLLLFTMLPACGGKSDPPLAVLTVSEGNVRVTRSGSSSPVAGSVGMDLKPGDTIHTDAAARAAVTFFEGSVIELKSDTQVEISSLITAQESSSSTTISLKQQVGKTISTVKKLADSKSRYDVETPSAVAGVRGSTMYVSVAQDGRTIVGNIEGTITATAQGVEVQIPVNTHVTVAPGNPPEQPQPGATPDLQSSAPASTPGRTVSNILFGGSGVAFNYPDTWQTIDKTQYNDPTMIAYFKEPGKDAYIQVTVQDMLDNVSVDDLKTYHDAWMSGFIIGQPISSKSLTVAGLPAYDTVFNDDVSRWRLVTLAKGSKVYDLSLSANTDSFDQANKEFDILVNSFVVQ